MSSDRNSDSEILLPIPGLEFIETTPLIESRKVATS